MSRYTLDNLISDAVRKGFTPTDVEGLVSFYYQEDESFQATRPHRVSQETRSEYLERMRMNSYIGGEKYIQRKVDSWQKEGRE
jgi:hypothetical protein